VASRRAPRGAGFLLGLLTSASALAAPPARIDGEPVTEGELAGLRSAREAPLPEATLLEEVLNRRLLVRAARERGLHEVPEVRRELRRTRRDILIRALTEQLTRERASAEEVRAFYDEHFGGRDRVPQIRLLRASAPDRDRAADLLRVPDGAGDAGEWHYPALLSAPLREALGDEPEPGTRVGPVALAGGWTVARVTDHRRTSPPALAAVRPAIRELLRRRALTDLLGRLREEARIVYPEGPPASE
jgi:peptidyl-prolyl cis-trans isomerase C